VSDCAKVTMVDAVAAKTPEGLRPRQFQKDGDRFAFWEQQW